MAKAQSWGLLPEQVLARLQQTEWDNWRNLKRRLGNAREFPIVIPFKAPTGQQALANVPHFYAYVQAWKNFSHAELVQWQTRQYRTLSAQDVPVSLVIPNIAILANLLGQQPRFEAWLVKISYMMQQVYVLPEIKSVLFQTLVEFLPQIEQLAMSDLALLAQLIPQLQANMGQGFYLRALPLQQVDTKFLETHLRLIEAICDVLHHADVYNSGGLLSWLNCLDHPKGWLMVKPLCTEVQQSLGGLPLFQLSTDVLTQFELPAQHIFVVENIQSGLALPRVANAIVVCGGGKNIAWLKAQWLKHKQVYYWGDLDSEGLKILSNVRQIIPHVNALMMDERTVLAFEKQMVDEPDSVFMQPACLTQAELQLFYKLRNREFYNRRLEQERISSDWIVNCLNGLF